MHALAQLCIRRPVFATMLVLSRVVVGVFCYFGLGVDLFPKVDIPTVVVRVSDRGASPEEIETEITKKVEDAVTPIAKSMKFAPPRRKGSRSYRSRLNCRKMVTPARRRYRTKLT